MLSQEKMFRRQHADITVALENAFPGVQPPESRWILLWLQKYPFPDILAAIQTLRDHPLRAKFTTESVGRAISALLRETAMQRVASKLPATSSAASSVFTENTPPDQSGTTSVNTSNPPKSSASGEKS